MKLFLKKNSHKTALLNGGLSIIEIVIVMGILGGIIGLVGTFQAGVFSMNRLFGSSMSVSFEGNRAMKDITKTVRPLSQSAQGAFPVELAATSTFTFFSDVDSDGVIERVRYFLSSTTLMKGITKPTGNPIGYLPANESSIELAHFVRNPATTSIFTYYDRNYAGTTTPLTQPVSVGQVRHVRVYLMLDEDVNRQPEPFVVQTSVTFRNLKDNQ